MAVYLNFVRSNQIFAPKSGLLGKKVAIGALIKSGLLFARYGSQISAIPHNSIVFGLHTT